MTPYSCGHPRLTSNLAPAPRAMCPDCYMIRRKMQAFKSHEKAKRKQA